MRRRVAVVGAGWAGLAAAVAATDGGHDVTVLEAARVAGGRARTLHVRMPDGAQLALDNGQHILIGAYVETLRLMERVGVEPAQELLRLPLVLRRPDGTGIALPLWPSPFDAAAGILGARGWSWRDKLSLLRAAAGWQLGGFRCDPEATVADLCGALTARIRDDLVDPLCVAALNTPADRASGQVFLRVLRDSLFGPGHGDWGGSNLLLPREPLGHLLPEAAQAWLQARGAQVRLGERVQHIVREDTGWRVDGEAYDEVVLACPASEAARLVRDAGDDAAWAAGADAFTYEAITTVYVTGGPRLQLPMLSLRAGPDAPAQFVFDRSQLGGPPGLLAFVASASEGGREAVEAQVLAQARALGYGALQVLQTVVEKRATFACVPGLQRPGIAIARGLWACGDYVEGPYPATLEGAVRAGLDVASRLGTPHHGAAPH